MDTTTSELSWAIDFCFDEDGILSNFLEDEEEKKVTTTTTRKRKKEKVTKKETNKKINSFSWENIPPLKKKVKNNKTNIILDEKKNEKPTPCQIIKPGIIHKKSTSLIDQEHLFRMIYSILGGKNENFYTVYSYIIICLFGQRSLQKEPISDISNLSNLSNKEYHIFENIQRKLSDPKRKQRIFDLIQDKRFTKRLITYFVVHYCLEDQVVSYYLDRTEYPYKIVGELNNPNQPEIYEMINNQGRNIVWVNLHQEYKNCKKTSGRKNRHAPYRRSTCFRLNDDPTPYSLCEMNFYIWFDEIGAYDAFLYFEQDVRKKKSEFDERSRKKQSDQKKTKVMLSKTSGMNYQPLLIQSKSSPVFEKIKKNLSLLSQNQMMMTPSSEPDKKIQRKKRKRSVSKTERQPRRKKLKEEETVIPRKDILQIKRRLIQYYSNHMTPKKNLVEDFNYDVI